MKVFGPYPDIALACMEAEQQYHNVIHPLEVLKAHIRRRYKAKIGGCLKTAIANAEREESEAEVAEMRLALNVDNPEPEMFEDYIKERREHLLAEERVLEIAEDIHYSRGAR